MKIIVDVQGFKTSKTTFTPKELAVFDGVHISHYIFKAPFPFSQLPPDLQKQAEWLINNHHCIAWDEGFTPPHYFQNILRKLADAADDIYVKGKEKTKYMPLFNEINNGKNMATVLFIDKAYTDIMAAEKLILLTDVDGILVVRSNPGEGTTVHAELPCE